MYYHGARYYIPWLARWSASDPMENKYAGMSPYNYSMNNPVMMNDPSGADPQQQTANPPIAYTHDDNGDIQGYIGEVTITSGKKSSGSAADNTAFSPSAGYALQAEAMKEGLFLGQFKTSDKLENNDLYYSTPFGWAAAGTGGTPYSAEVRAANGLLTVNEARQADSDGQSDYQWALNNQLRQAGAEGYNEVQRLNNPFYLGFKAGKAAYDFTPIHAGISAYKDYQAGNNTGAVVNTAFALIPALKIGKLVKAGEETILLRHYTSNKGLAGIQADMEIKSYDKFKVFAENANSKVLSAADASDKFGIMKSSARNYIEFEVPLNLIEKTKNPITKAMEYTVKGNVKLNPQTTKFIKRK